MHTYISSAITQNSKVLALETSLQQSMCSFKELISDFEQLHIEHDKCKSELTTLKEKCESKTCISSEELNKIIQVKENIIQSAALTLTKLSETKNWSILDEVFKILFGETQTPHLASRKEVINNKIIKEELISPNNELAINGDLSSKDDSVSEIEGTPTGRTSPIILTKKMKSHMMLSDREKKKCPETWRSSDNKVLKLTFTTPTRSKPNSRLRQARLSIVKIKPTNVIDITSSPEFCGGSRNINSEAKNSEQPLVKSESIDNDDTIMPSPSRENTNYKLLKSPLKFNKPQLSLKPKSEKCNSSFKKPEPYIENKCVKKEKTGENDDLKEMGNCNSVTYTQDDSINILHPDRLPKHFKSALAKQKEHAKSSPKKHKSNKPIFDDTESSVSLMQHINNLNDIHKKEDSLSPNKRPLVENINTTNILKDYLETSVSLLPRDPKLCIATENVKRRLLEPIEYEAPAPRTRAEKRQLPGWACEKCINFFSELHKDDPDLMWNKINECSHHRGVNNPERPKTPPGYWNPRFDIPDDTEEFNRRNNV